MRLYSRIRVYISNLGSVLKKRIPELHDWIFLCCLKSGAKLLLNYNSCHESSSVFPPFVESSWDRAAASPVTKLVMPSQKQMEAWPEFSPNLDIMCCLMNKECVLALWWGGLCTMICVSLVENAPRFTVREKTDFLTESGCTSAH